MTTPDPAASTATAPTPAWLEKLSSIEGLDGLLSILWRLAILYGGVWIFQYCYFGIGYTPVGLSIGDGVYWLFLSVAIGLSALMLAVLGAVGMWPLAGLKPIWSGTHTGWRRAAAWVAVLALLVGLGTEGVLWWLAYTRAQGGLADHALALVWTALGNFALFALLSHACFRAQELSLALGLSLLAAVGYAVLTMGVLMQAFGFLASVLFGGFCLVLMVRILDDKTGQAPNRTLVIWVFGGCIFFGPMLVNHVTETQVNFMSRQVFHRLGLSHQDVNVVLHGDAAKTVAQLVDREQIQALTCQLNDDTLQVSGVDVPWTGLGARTLLAFPTRPAEQRGQDTTPQSGDASPRLAVDAEQVSVLEEAHTRCADLPTAIYFDSGSHTANDSEALAKLKGDFEAAQALAGTRWVISKLHIAAHADPMPMGGGGRNDVLARQRAQDVLDKIGFRGLPPVPYLQPEVEIEVVGSRHLEKSNCGLKGSREALAECEAVNRRVQVRVLWRRVQPLG
jgi:outer membrane protein OmpA-like peptidoglycan-associated protein